MNAPASGGYCVLYINGVETLGVDADARGICHFGYVAVLVTLDIVGYQMTNNDFIETGVTAHGETKLTVPCSCTHIIKLQ